MADRGLDILNRIQKELSIKVEIYEGDFEEIQEVDQQAGETCEDYKWDACYQ